MGFKINRVLDIFLRALPRLELLYILNKIKKFTRVSDRILLNEMIDKEVYHYSEVKIDYQGEWVKVLEPESLRQEMKGIVGRMLKGYEYERS